MALPSSDTSDDDDEDNEDGAAVAADDAAAADAADPPAATAGPSSSSPCCSSCPRRECPMKRASADRAAMLAALDEGPLVPLDPSFLAAGAPAITGGALLQQQEQ